MAPPEIGLLTQERVEPKREDSDARVAEPRRPRRSPIGHLSRHDLTPWMQQVVREYFLTLRAEPERDDDR